jgi:hypothetical protein
MARRLNLGKGGQCILPFLRKKLVWPNSYVTLAPGVMVAATQQHVGKTSTCLGLMSGLLKRFDKVGFCKPGDAETIVSIV